MKKLSLILTLLLAFAFAVSAATAPQLSMGAIPTATVSAGSTASFTFTLKNTVSGTSIPTVTLTSTAPTKGSLTLETPTIASVTDLDGSKDITFTITVPSGAQAGDYTATLTATDSSNSADTAQRTYTLHVNSVPSIAFAPSDIKIFGEPGDDVTRTITLTNNGNVDLTNLVLSHDLGDLRDSDDNIIRFTITPTAISSLTVGASTQVTLKESIDSSFQKQSFTGSLKIASAQGPLSAPLEVGSKPLACQAGRVGHLNVDINRPDSGDEFTAGAKIPVEVNVENTGNDVRVVLEAVLYNNDRDRVEDTYKSGERTIDKDEDHDYKFNLELRSSAHSDDSYTIYTKASERSKEDKNCDDSENVDVDVHEVEDRVTVDSFTLSPLSATCGDNVYGSLRVANQGSNEADVKVTVRNTELGFEQDYPGFTLDQKDESNSDNTVNFNFRIPDRAKDKNYQIDALVTYNGFDATTSRTLTVSGCSAPVVVPTPITGNIVTPVGGNNVQPPAVVYTQKSFLDQFGQIPRGAWILADIVLVLLVILIIVGIVRKSRNN